MPVTVVPFEEARCRPGHHNTILASGVMPPELGLPVSTHYGLLKPGMAQEPAADARISKLYVPLEGEADLIADGVTYRLRRGSVYFIRRGTHHTVRHVGEADFVNVCIAWEEPDHG